MLKFRGSYANFGKLYAEQLHTQHYNLHRELNTRTLHKQLAIYQKFYPELITERISTATCLNLDLDHVLYQDFATFIDKQRQRITSPAGCTIFALNHNNKTYIGRNYDWLPEARKSFKQYDLAFENRFRYFAFSDEGIYKNLTGKFSGKFYPEDAINECGLYIGFTFAHINEWNYGLLPSHFIRYIAEHCQSTQEALHAFREIPCAIPKNFLIADAHGEIAVVEHAARKYRVLHPDRQDYLIHTNHCLSPDLQKLDQVQKHNPRTSTFVRFAEASFLLNQKLPEFSFNDIAPIMRKSHYIYNDHTIWTLALELTEQRFAFYSGDPASETPTEFYFD